MTEEITTFANEYIFVGDDDDDDNDDDELDDDPHAASIGNWQKFSASFFVYEGSRLQGLGSPEHV